MTNSIKNAGRIAQRISYVIFGIVYSLSIVGGSVNALSTQDLSDVLNLHTYYKADDVAVCTTDPGGTVTPSSGLPAGSKIYMVGDSITVQSKAALETAFAGAQFTSTINALSGRAISVNTAGGEETGILAVRHDASIIGASDAVVIALGTNSGTEDLDTQIPLLVAEIRKAKQNVPIYWVNLFYTKDPGPSARNTKIANNSDPAKSDYAIINAFSASIPLDTDKTHPTVEGRTKFAQTVVAGLSAPSPTSGTTADAYSLTYPNYPDVAGLALKMDEFIRKQSPNSPYLSIPDFSARLIAEGKLVNANPLIPLFIAMQESTLGTSPVASQPRNNIINYNSFGNKGNPDANGDGYREWPSFEASFFGADSFTDGIPRRLASSPNYVGVATMEDYLSVHVSGRIIKPGDATRVFDPIMQQWVDSSSVLTYFKNVSKWILEATGQTAPGGGGGGTCGSNTGNNGAQLPAGPGGYDLPGEGANPMVYYSQEVGCPGNKKCNAAVKFFGDKYYGKGSIQDCGCAPTSIAMISATLAGTGKTPVDVADWLIINKSQDTTDCGTNSAFLGKPNESFTTAFGVTYSSITAGQITDTLKNGRLVLMSVNNSAYPVPNDKNDGGHYVVIRQVTDDGHYLLADPFAYGWKAVDDGSNIPFTIDQISNMVRSGIWAFSRA